MQTLMMLKMLFILLVWLPLFCATTLNANEIQPLQSNAAIEQIRTLIKTDRLFEASSDISRQLQQQPGNSELQFLQCVVQSNQKKVSLAIGCFKALVKAHPEMVEAYNNLGVLHASLGHYEEAKQWFDNGLRRVPALWTVHQNILNLQAELSRKAYSRALQIEPSTLEPQARLNFLATTSVAALTSTSSQDTKTTSHTTAKPPAQTASSPAAEDSGRSLTPRLAQGNTSITGKGNVTPPVKQALNESAVAKTQTDLTQIQVQQAIQAWAKAWSDKNLSSYFSAYSAEFTPEKEVSYAAWKTERTARILGRQFIHVNLSNITFENTYSKVVARFTQTYESDNLFLSNRKRLDLMFEDGRWKIVRETVISNTP